MSAPFLSGISTPLYTWATMSVTMVFMMICQFHLTKTLNLITTEEDTKSSKTNETSGPYRWPAFMTLAVVGIAYAFMGMWWNDLTSASQEWGFKVVWVSSNFIIASIVILLEIPYLLFEPEFLRNSMSIRPSVVSGPKESFRYTNYPNFLYFLHILCFIVLLLMSLLCLYTFPGNNGNLTGDYVTRSLTVALASVIFVWLTADTVSKVRFNSKTSLASSVDQPATGDMPLSSTGLTETEKTIQSLVAGRSVKALDLSDVKIDNKLAAVATAGLGPFALIRTGNLAYDRNVPENQLLHRIENDIIKPDTKTNLNIKDYHVVQTSPDQVLVMPSEMSKLLREVTPGGELTEERHGLLRRVKKVYPDDKLYADLVDNKTKNPRVTTMVHEEGKRHSSFFYRIFQNEPGALMFDHHVLGFGVGNGLWINTPSWFSFLVVLFFLALEMQIWRDDEVGLQVVLITIFPAFMFSLWGYQRNFLPLFWLNRMIGFFCIIVQKNWVYGGGGTQYVAANSILYNTSAPWLGNQTAGNPSDVISVQITTYFAASCIFLWACWSGIRTCFALRNHEKLTP